MYRSDSGRKNVFMNPHMHYAVSNGMKQLLKTADCYSQTISSVKFKVLPHNSRCFPEILCSFRSPDLATYLFAFVSQYPVSNSFETAITRRENTVIKLDLTEKSG